MPKVFDAHEQASKLAYKYQTKVNMVDSAKLPNGLLFYTNYNCKLYPIKDMGI